MVFTGMIALLAGSLVTAAGAQSYQTRDAARDLRQEQRELREAQAYGSRRDVREQRRDVREARQDLRQSQRRDWRRYRDYDWNRREPGSNGYYAERYYRDGRYYRTRTLSRNDRIYRGGDGRYYCRRDDGTTGLILGGVLGGVLGNALDNGRSSTLGTVLGAGGGALLGREVDRGGVKCR
nr:glycine zipper 2TM domain-containing protein [Sphingomonas quercus]